MQGIAETVPHVVTVPRLFASHDFAGNTMKAETPLEHLTMDPLSCLKFSPHTLGFRHLRSVSPQLTSTDVLVLLFMSKFEAKKLVWPEISLNYESGTQARQRDVFYKRLGAI